MYQLTDNDNNAHTVTIPNILYVPKNPSRPICPPHLLLATKDDNALYDIQPHSTSISFHGSKFTISYDDTLNIQILFTTRTTSDYTTYCTTIGSAPSIPPPEMVPSLHPIPDMGFTNLRPAQQEKMELHHKLIYENFNQTNSWIRDGTIKASKAVANSRNPICPACQFGKAKCRSHGSDQYTITKDHTAPGEDCLTDLLVAGHSGLTPTAKGQPTKHRYTVAAFWVDHYSDYVLVTFFEKQEATELVKSKEEFEAFANQHNVHIMSIHADTGIYSSKTFCIACANQRPHILCSW